MLRKRDFTTMRTYNERAALLGQPVPFCKQEDDMETMSGMKVAGELAPTQQDEED
jgi:hypothetical protein